MTHDELLGKCKQILGFEVAKGCISLLDEIALLEEQRGGNTTPIFWELLAERDKLKDEVEQLQEDVKAWIAHARRTDDNEQKLEARLQATREVVEPLIARLDEADQAKQIDKHIGLTPDDRTTWVRVGDLRRLKEVYEDKDYDN